MKYLLFDNIANKKDSQSLYLSSIELCSQFDIGLKKVENTNFYDALDVNLLDDGLTSIVIDAYNLALAEESDLAILCLDDLSFNNYTKTKECLKSNKKLKDEVNTKLSQLGKEYKGRVEIKHIIELISNDIGVEKIASRVKNSFKDFNIAVHYGNSYCELKEKLNIENIEIILNSIGAKVIKLDSIYNSLGSEYLNSNSEIAYKMAGEILLDMFDCSTDIVTSTDTNTFIMFDKNQKAIECEMGRDIKIPFLNLAQLILLAIGEVETKKLGLEYHKIVPKFI